MATYICGAWIHHKEKENTKKLVRSVTTRSVQWNCNRMIGHGLILQFLGVVFLWLHCQWHTTVWSLRRLARGHHLAIATEKWRPAHRAISFSCPDPSIARHFVVHPWWRSGHIEKERKELPLQALYAHLLIISYILGHIYINTNNRNLSPRMLKKLYGRMPGWEVPLRWRYQQLVIDHHKVARIGVVVGKSRQRTFSYISFLNWAAHTIFK